MSNIKLAKREISRVIEALEPPDRPARTFRDLTSRPNADSAVASDRGFIWSPSTRSEVSGETGAAGPTSLVVWECSFVLLFTMDGKSVRDLNDAIEDETQLIMSALEAIENWPSGVTEIITGSTEVELLGEDGAAVVFEFTITCEESNQ